MQSGLYLLLYNGDNSSLSISNGAFIPRILHSADCLSLFILSALWYLLQWVPHLWVSHLSRCSFNLSSLSHQISSSKSQSSQEWQTLVASSPNPSWKKSDQMSSQACFRVSFPDNLLLHVSILAWSYKQTSFWIRHYMFLSPSEMKKTPFSRCPNSLFLCSSSLSSFIFSTLVNFTRASFYFFSNR